jgi:hypothetical protein
MAVLSEEVVRVSFNAPMRLALEYMTARGFEAGLHEALVGEKVSIAWVQQYLARAQKVAASEGVKWDQARAEVAYREGRARAFAIYGR